MWSRLTIHFSHLFRRLTDYIVPILTLKEPIIHKTDKYNNEGNR